MSPFEQNLFDQVAELTELYLRNEISAEQMAELEALVREDKQAANVMRTVMQQAGMMRVVFGEQRQFAHRIGEVDRDEYLKLLQTLSPTEEPEPVHLIGRIGSDRPWWQHWPVVMAGSIAALLAIAVTLTITLSGSTAPTPNVPMASTPSTPRGSIVATLTAEHNAAWDRQSGEDLFAGQRFTLTRGFAEITTARGAVAIIEAPATIELLDNENAVYLHAGKLVGICETELSQGFVVKTDYADITDLGTEFGVEVANNQLTTTVFTGEVTLTAPGGKPQSLVANQTAQLRVNGVNRKLTVKDQLAQGFEELRTHRMSAAALRNDPAMIAYYGFEAEDLVNGKLLNRAQATLGKMDGILGQAGRADSKPTLTQGRRPGTGALRFEAEEYDLVRIPATDAKAIDGLEQFTIGVWVKPDNMNQESHHLLTKRLSNQQSVVNFGLAWEIPPVGGYLSNTVFLNRHSMDSEATASFKADALKRDSRWMHIVVTFDHGERVLYKDGQLIERLPALGPDRDAALDAELLIGAASPHLDELGTYLDGDLDELFILGRVMSEQGVRAMYEAGVPGPPAETRGPAAPVP